MKKVTVIGLGYIGLPTSLFFAKAGYEVNGIDVNEEAVNKLKQGIITFDEPGLNDLFQSVKEKINFATKPVVADLFIITVPTPFNEDKTIDEKYINIAFDDIKNLLKKGDSIVLESTVPPMVTEKMISKIESLGFKVGQDIYLAHVPETIIPGNMVKEFETNKRLIGGATTKCAQVIADYYRKVVKGEIILTDLRTAEFTKVIENTFRDVNIAVANEFMRLADKLGIDVYEAIEIANKHPRVNILSPGLGVGGHCISVDPWFLVGLFPKSANLINTARIINDEQPIYIFDKLSKQYNLTNKTVGVYGLSYKPNTDDVRESPTFTFIDILKQNNISYTSFDPYFVKEKVEAKQLLDFDEFINSCDIVVLCLKHDHILKNINKLKNKQVFTTFKK